MSDLTASCEASEPPPRPLSSDAEDVRYHYENVHEVATGQPASPSHTRRRPSRTSSGSKSSPLSGSPPRVDEYGESDRKAKIPRNTLKKLLRRDSHQADTPPTPRGEQEDSDQDESTVGYIPRLRQIKEGKTGMNPGRRRSSTVSSGRPKAIRRRQTEESSVGRSRVHRKHASLQRHSTSPANSSDPSVVSSVTQPSSSSGSNSTVTENSYEYSHFSQYEQPSPALAKMDSAQSEVFKYLQSEDPAESIADTDLQGMPSSSVVSSSSSSSGDTRLGDGGSSVATDSTYSAATSPASVRRSGYTDSNLSNQEFRKFKKPLYASSFVHGPGDEENEQPPDESEGEENGGSDGKKAPGKNGHARNKVATKATSRRAPSAASRRSDTHSKRLKNQERELANHILQAPQPQKDIQFGTGQAAHGYPAMPMYSPHAYPGASPAVTNASLHSPSGWPPTPSLPAPLAIGYAPHQSPEAAHAYPIPVKAPMAPEGVVQRMPPPFSPHSAQPPHYQQHAPASNQTRPTVMGYELLANELTASSRAKASSRKGLVPMYRKFEHLNHRVLLHLQDETCELEEELRQLDECIAQMSPRDAEGYEYPASRRSDARYGSDMHFKRTELLGRIFQKLEQYNKALSSFSSMSKELDRPTTKDIKAYRGWMDENEPLDYAESQFIERDSDLVAIPRKASIKTAPVADQDQSAAVWFPLTLVLPLMAFAIVPSLVGRLLVLVAMVGAELKLVKSTPELKSFMSTQEWNVAASIYFGLNVLLAVLVR
ncbi:PAT1 multi-domain protein [Pyrenophora teres f. maculata]|nr:PAT1 multi-domain protein [Pyrenophora teres f. maculata]